jgi:hypothetical protein
MCYGGLDPKYLMRDTEARVKHPSYEQDTSNLAAPAGKPGLVAWINAAMARLTRKGPAHV